MTTNDVQPDAVIGDDTAAGVAVTEQTVHTADEILVELVAAGVGDATVAAASGLSPRTVARRKADPEIQRRITERRSVAFEGLRVRLADLADAALAQLKHAMTESRNVSSRLRAVEMWFEMTMQIKKVLDCDQRLDLLEDRIKGLTK